jgi:hypothetical protein
MTTASPTTLSSVSRDAQAIAHQDVGWSWLYQDRPTLSVFDNSATLTGDVAAVRQMLPGVWGDSSS